MVFNAPITCIKCYESKTSEYSKMHATSSQMLFVPTRPSRPHLFCGCSVRQSVRLSRFATRCGCTVAISTPRICRKNSNVKTNRAVRFSADKYAEAEAI